MECGEEIRAEKACLRSVSAEAKGGDFCSQTSVPMLVTGDNNESVSKKFETPIEMYAYNISCIVA
jgi:hypothetical protein